MFSCFGSKSSSQEEISTKNKTSNKGKELKRSATISTGNKVLVNDRSVTSTTVINTSSIRTFSQQQRKSWTSTSIPSTSHRRSDALPFSNIKPKSPLAQNPSTSSVSSPQKLKNVAPNKNKYKVKKSHKYYDNFRSGPIPVYQTHSENRGRALIVNNVKFHKEELYRRGAKKDEKDLADVLKQIGFQVERHSDVKRTDIQRILKKFTSEPKLKKVDICMVVVMSHGTNNNIPGGYTELVCADGKRIATEDVINYFNESECIMLRDKPKIFIFQCCRNSYESDGLLKRDKPQDKSNTLIAYSTIPGFTSNRHVEEGTWYIQTICKVFAEHAHENDIQDLLMIVDKEMNNIDSNFKQVSSYENRGFSRCYLHPR